MKRITALVLAFMMLMSGFCFAMEMETIDPNAAAKESYRQELLALYMESPEFLRHYESDPEEALANIDRIVEAKFESNSGVEPLAGTNLNAYTSPALFKQALDYYCGPAAALTVLTGMGRDNVVYGADYTAKQQTIASWMNTDVNGETYVGDLVSGLNRYTGGVNYSYVIRTAMTMDQFASNIHSSLLANNMPILHAKTEHFDYYNGHSTGHYISIYMSNAVNSVVANRIFGVVDNHRNDAYYGYHNVTVQEAWNAIGSARYLIIAL